MKTFLAICEIACSAAFVALQVASLWASRSSGTKPLQLMRALRLNRAALIAAAFTLGIIAAELAFGFWTWTWIFWVFNIVATLVIRHFLGIRWHLSAGGR